MSSEQVKLGIAAGSSADPKVQELLQRIANLKGVVKESSAALAKQAGMTQEQLSAYLADSTHFTPTEWETASHLRQELGRKFSHKLTDPKKLRKSDQEIARDSQNRKSKTLGARKNWVSVR